MIPAHISDFLRSTIRTTWALDLLRLLKSEDERSWTVRELTAELRGSDLMVSRNLEVFKKWGLVSEDSADRYRYVANEVLDPIVIELLAIYRERPLAIFQEIAKSPNDKLFSFVDAFRLKKD